MNLQAYGIDFQIDGMLKKDIEAFLQAKEESKE